MAGGLSLEQDKLESFRQFMISELAEDVTKARANLSLKIDSLIAPTMASEATIATIDKVGPYGAGNPQPIFALSDMRISYAERVRGGHVRCAFENSAGDRISGICFRADKTGLSDILLDPNAPRVHIAGRLKADSWKGRSRVDFQLLDMALA